MVVMLILSFSSEQLEQMKRMVALRRIWGPEDKRFKRTEKLRFQQIDLSQRDAYITRPGGVQHQPIKINMFF